MSDVFDAYAAYYDLLYADKDYAGEAEYVQRLLAGAGTSRGELLELGSGTGRHACHLAELGYDVTGIDASPGMVEQARQRAGSVAARRPEFEVGDARTARLGRQYDAVVSLFHVASYQSTNADLAAMIGTAAEHLRAGGVFLFDCWYGPGVLTDPPAVRVKRMGNESAQIVRIAEPVLHPNENLVDVRFTVLVTDRRSGAVSEIEETHRMRYLFLPELRLLLEQAGMELVTAETWLTGAELSRDSWQAVVLARRTGDLPRERGRQ